MACPRFSLVPLLWLFLLSIHLIRGREIPKDASLIVTQRGQETWENLLTPPRLFYVSMNTSTLQVDISAQMAPQMTSKMDAAKQTIINHWANLRMYKREYYGVQASLNVYGLPTVKNGQVTSIRIWVLNGYEGTFESYNAIQAGWMVNLDRYGDHDTHFFVLWTVDVNYTTGCVDFDCKGFVLHNTSQLVPGYRLQPLSKYNGEQRFITLKISKDRVTGDWWLHYGSDGKKPVGYWPKSLFTSLANSAKDVAIGGVTTFFKGGVSPPMGSGHDATEGEGKAASIKYSRLIDESGSLHTPDVFGYYYEFDNCYNITGEARSTLYVGGPGGCKD